MNDWILIEASIAFRHQQNGWLFTSISLSCCRAAQVLGVWVAGSLWDGAVRKLSASEAFSVSSASSFYPTESPRTSQASCTYDYCGVYLGIQISVVGFYSPQQLHVSQTPSPYPTQPLTTSTCYHRPSPRDTPHICSGVPMSPAPLRHHRRFRLLAPDPRS